MGRWACFFVFTCLSLALIGFYAEANHCVASKATSCSACLQSSFDCNYCADEVFLYDRCDLLENLKSEGCVMTISEHSSVSIEENERINKNLKHSQVAPQSMRMTLLPGEQRDVDLEVFETVRGPLDLYILMDFSNSMSDDLDNLKRMGDELANLVSTLSDDYTIGFGKFVDKVSDPQTDMRPSKLKEPWPNSDPPFSFQHVIPLTSNISSFRQILQKERISGNLDAPEGGFDAILQAAVCQPQIGWRKHSTHLLVFSTESAFHYETDGMNVLAGILARNDEACHLNTQGKYTRDILQDYPSVPMLVKVLVDNNIIPIFAITEHSRSYYEKLVSYFPIAELGVLQMDSSNILNIIKSAFESIRSKISIQAENQPKAISAQILSSSGVLSDFGNFSIQPGEIGKFKVRLNAKTRDEDKPVCSLNTNEREGNIRVKPTTFSSALQIQTSVLCKTCNCELTPQVKAARCHGNGDLVCGTCRCYSNWLGPFCNCSSQVSSDTGCVAPGMTEPCYGRGDCLCGTCMCYKPSQYEGQYCQYDKSQCLRSGGFLCNDRGQCFMGKCVCDNGWTGDACECPLSNVTCLDTKGGLCNGRGVCKCGRCECSYAEFQLSASCEPNFQAQWGICESMKSCVQCQAWKTGEMKGEKCKQCPFKIIMVDELKERQKVIESCEYRDEEDDCTYYYTVNYPPNPTDKTHQVEVRKKKDCPPGGFLWLIPLIMFLMLLLGLLLLCCWKFCACCKALAACLPCCGVDRQVGFKEDSPTVHQSLLTSDHWETPLVRTGQLKHNDVVHWKVSEKNQLQNRIQTNTKEQVEFPLSLRLHRTFSDDLLRPDAPDTEQLRHEVEENINNVYKQIPGAQRVQKTRFRTQRNAGHRQNNTVVDTVLSAPRSSFPDIVNLTDKQVQAGNFSNMRVVPGFYTVASDREAKGAVEMQEGVESVDVRVPLFIKDEDDDKKQLLVEMDSIPEDVGLGKDKLTITVVKSEAKSIVEFVQPSYTFSRQEGVVNIPVKRMIRENGPTHVTCCSRDLTAKDKKDYISVDGDLIFQPGETQKNVPVRLLELDVGDALLDSQPKQFVLDLSNPRDGAKLGRYPRSTVTITDNPVDITNMKKISKVMSPTGRLGPPTNIKASAAGPKKIHMNWNPQPGARSYKVKYWIYGDPEADAQVLEVKNSQAELNNLYPYCDYEMRVCSSGPQGDGEYSELVQCQTLEDVPSEPGRLAFNIIGPTVTQVSWAEPAEPNGVITEYELVYTPINEDSKPIGPDKKVKIDNPKKRMLLIENLQPSQTYRYKVRASNKVGWGPYRDATINLATQPPRPMSIPIIPDIPIVDAEAGEEYDSYLMYSNEVLRSPTSSTRPSMSELSEEQITNGKWDQSFLFPGGGGSLTRNISTSSTSYSLSPRPGLGGQSVQTTTFITNKGGSMSQQQNLQLGGRLQPEEVILRKRSENRDYYENEGVRDSIVMSDLTTGFSDILGGSSFSQSSTTSYSLSSRFHDQSEDISTALQNLDRVLQGSRLPHGVPETPSRLVFSALGPTALKVSWQEPHCENPILGYCVLYQLLNGGEMKRLDVSNPLQNSVVVQDLLPNQSYLFKVKAQSHEGWGSEREGVITIESTVDPKSPLSPVPGSPFTLSTPSAPGPLVFTALSPETLQLSWDRPRKPNGEIVGYVVTCEQLHGGGDQRSFQLTGNSSTSLTVSDLKENLPYKFKVQAQTTQGFGPEREGIITIESQDGGYSSQSVMRRDVFNLPTQSSTHTTHTMFTEPLITGDGMMMSSRQVTQRTELGGAVTRHVEVVQRGMTSTVTKKYQL